MDSTGSITIVHPGSSLWEGYAKPVGALVIPDSVLHGGTLYPVTAIGKSAFYECDSLTSVILPQGLISIDSRAFGIHDSPLTNIVIPDGVSEIGKYAFSGIRHIEYHGNATWGTNTYWGAYSMNGVTVGDFVFADSSMTVLTGYIGTATNVTIPATVDTIANHALYRFKWLSTVAFPEGVHFIGENAFYMCEALVSLSLPDSLTAIGAKAFYGCLNLADVRIPDRVDTIGRNAFYLFRHIEYHGSATYDDDNLYWGAYSLNGVRNGYFVYTDSSRTTLTVTEDMTVVAHFAAGSQGIEEIDDSKVNIGITGLSLSVSNPDGDVVDVYDISGRLLARSRISNFNYRFSTSGVYIIKVGNHTTRKIVAIR